jgi:hypothetical protein
MFIFGEGMRKAQDRLRVRNFEEGMRKAQDRLRVRNLELGGGHAYIRGAIKI